MMKKTPTIKSVTKFCRSNLRLWSTDFADSVVSSSVSPSNEDKRALEMMEQSLKVVNGHFQVGLPW